MISKIQEYLEYEGMLLPFGSKSGKNIMFNHEQIKKVLFEGLKDKHEIELVKEMEKLIKKQNLKKKKVK